MGGEIYLADGVGGFNEQGIDPGMYARVLTYEAAKAHTALAKNPLASPNPKKTDPSCTGEYKTSGVPPTIVIIELLGTKLSAASIGDSGFRVVRDGKSFCSPPRRRSTTSTVRTSLDMKPLNKDVDLAIDAQEFEVAPYSRAIW